MFDSSIFGECKSKLSSPEIVRRFNLAEKIVIVDGLPGCGKTMLSPIVAAMERAEKLTYAYELELICQLNYLKKIEPDAAIAMVKTLTDLKLYNIMMSRETNFRPGDLSSVFSAPKPLTYLRRLFQKGERMIPERIKKEKPILHLTTHALLGISRPVFSALNRRVAILEVVRHPLYMIKQQVMNMERYLTDARYFPVFISYGQGHLPFFTFGWEDLFFNSNPVERAIYYIDRMSKITESAKEKLFKEYGTQIITIPFESFVVEPWPYMKIIEQVLETRATKVTRQAMRRQRVPRKMYAQGIGLKIYKRCGWEAPMAGSDENKEFQKRWQFAKQRASKESMQVLGKLCVEYEKKYMGGIKKTGESYE